MITGSSEEEGKSDKVSSIKERRKRAGLGIWSGIEEIIEVAAIVKRKIVG